MDNQQNRSLKLAKTVGVVLSQDIAKLVLLNEVSAAADISSKLKSFTNLNTMVLYKLDTKAVFQYSKDDKSFIVDTLPSESKRESIIIKNNMKLYINASYQDTHLGYVQLNFKIETIRDVIKKNIQMLLFILSFMFIISYILAIFYAKRFTQPILKLVKFLEKIEEVDSLSKRVYTKQNNEYGKLYEEVNTMLERINSSQEALKIAAVSFETQNGMTITDKDMKILQVNKAFSNITGYKQEEAIGNTPSILKSGMQDELFYKNMHNSLSQNHFWSGEINNRHKDGTILKEYLTIQVVLDDNNEIKYYVASFSDITLQKATEAKLKEKETILVQQSKMAAMGEMLENIAHQWRQPLSVISTVSTGLLTKREYEIEVTKEEEIDSLNKINATTQYLSQTINDFRDFFKPNKEKVEFNLKDCYKKTLNLVNSKFASLDIEAIENLEDINLNNLDNELMQVMMNIFNNARDVLETKDGKRFIFVEICKEDNSAVIKIRDNAGGIPQDIINKVFEPYFTTKHKSQGTGIGLYVSNEMIEKHLKGLLQVDNRTYYYNDVEYKGACFRITLPLD
ncbi:MAG: PAS domain S-box protein [Campylobacterota bacterium]|nr:PAS domain S-box protein [Campylobacterota bacterium]